METCHDINSNVMFHALHYNNIHFVCCCFVVFFVSFHRCKKNITVTVTKYKTVVVNPDCNLWEEIRDLFSDRCNTRIRCVNESYFR